MNSLPKKMLKFFPNFLHMLMIPAFFILCVILYEPAPLLNLMDTGEGVLSMTNVISFNISITVAIILLVIITTRLLLYFLGPKLNLTVTWYLGWCLGEILIFSAFTALYLALISPVRGDYFVLLGRSFSAFAFLYIYPYIIALLAYSLDDARNHTGTDEGARLKFYDRRHLLKFVTYSSLIQYIEADENYVIIHYEENGVSKRYQLRNSMKSVEELCEKAGFVRTHRGFIVNPSHLKMIRKDGNGQYYADLGAGAEGGIPVSKKYYDKVMSLL